jgi:chorismate mutase
MSDLERLRDEIGALDRSVLETLNRRLGLVRRINEHKQGAGTPLIDAEREAALLRELAAANPGPLSEGAVQALFTAVLDVM